MKIYKDYVFFTMDKKEADAVCTLCKMLNRMVDECESDPTLESLRQEAEALWYNTYTFFNKWKVE